MQAFKEQRKFLILCGNLSRLILYIMCKTQLSVHGTDVNIKPVTVLLRLILALSRFSRKLVK